MIEKDDWRLIGVKENLVKNQVFRKVKFPELWRKSFNERNAFYQKIIEDAEKFVKAHKRGKEFLEGEKVQAFWHEHRFFCWEKFMTDKPDECYCSQDYSIWKCKTCLEDFKEKFNILISDDN